jgi:hypothetical protein
VPQPRQALFLHGVWAPTESQGGSKPPHSKLIVPG